MKNPDDNNINPDDIKLDDISEENKSNINNIINLVKNYREIITEIKTSKTKVN
jgi:hypothetical protein